MSEVRVRREEEINEVSELVGGRWCSSISMYAIQCVV